MSQKHIIEIECLQCHRKGQFTVWDIMNTGENPCLRKKIFDGSAFTYRCPDCGMLQRVPYSTLYIDQRHGMALFFGHNRLDDYDYQPLDLSHFTLIGAEDYTIRLVIGLNHLREKIMILETGLDDVAVELMKYMIAHYSSPEISMRGWDIYFDHVNTDDKDAPKCGSITFCLVDREGETYSGKSPMELYNEHCLAVKLDPRMRAEGCICIDDGWISRQLKGPHKDSREVGYRKPMKKRGYYKVGSGVRHNIQLPDGSLVLKEWPHDIFEIDGHDFFIFGNTVPKTSPTRYIRGIAHISGDVIYPPIFEHVRPLRSGKGWYTELDTAPYVLTLNGSIYDPEKRHLPQEN